MYLFQVYSIEEYNPNQKMIQNETKEIVSIVVREHTVKILEYIILGLEQSGRL